MGSEIRGPAQACHSSKHKGENEDEEEEDEVGYAGLELIFEALMAEDREEAGEEPDDGVSSSSTVLRSIIFAPIIIEQTARMVGAAIPRRGTWEDGEGEPRGGVRVRVRVTE